MICGRPRSKFDVENFGKSHKSQKMQLNLGRVFEVDLSIYKYLNIRGSKTILVPGVNMGNLYGIWINFMTN